MSKQYFPTMRVSDIVQCLDALDIKVSEAELTKPQPNTVLRLFETLADMLMNIQYGRYPGQLAQEGGIDAIVDDITDFPELHRDSMSMMMFFRQVSKVMLNIGVRNFCLKDLTHPEPGRIRMLLSAIINFARFREERLALFEELTAQSDELVKVKSENVQKRDSMTEQINSIQLQRSEEQPAVEVLTVETKELADQLKTFKNHGDEVNSCVSKMKSERTEVQDHTQNTQLMLQNNKQEVVRLRSRIVKNPDQLKRSIHDMHVSLQTLKQTVSGVERQSRDIQQKIDNLDSAEQDLVSCLQLLQECEEEYKNLEFAKQKVFSEKENVEKKHANYREVQVKQQQLNRQESSSQEKLTRLHNQLSLKQDSTMKKLDKYRDEWQELSADSTEVQKQSDAFSKQINDVKAKIQEMKMAVDVANSAAQNDMTKLKTVLSSQMSDFKYIMSEIDQIVV